MNHYHLKLLTAVLLSSLIVKTFALAQTKDRVVENTAKTIVLGATEVPVLGVHEDEPEPPSVDPMSTAGCQKDNDAKGPSGASTATIPVGFKCQYISYYGPAPGGLTYYRLHGALKGNKTEEDEAGKEQNVFCGRAKETPCYGISCSIIESCMEYKGFWGNIRCGCN